jgi:hypothetical protein
MGTKKTHKKSNKINCTGGALHWSVVTFGSEEVLLTLHVFVLMNHVAYLNREDYSWSCIVSTIIVINYIFVEM